jgi:hypothetical protein
MRGRLLAGCAGNRTPFAGAAARDVRGAGRLAAAVSAPFGPGGLAARLVQRGPAATLARMVPLALAGLPDLDRLRELLERIREMIALGGVALALAISCVFLVAWVVSHLRQPARIQTGSPGLLATLSLWLSYVPVGLTGVAALGAFVPTLAPFILKSFALAVLVAAFVWCVAIVSIIVGGNRQTLARARRALLLAGTPWYCLAVYLSTWL